MTSAAMAEPDLVPPPADLSLVQYAAVVAALAEGFRLDDVLAVEGVRDVDRPPAAMTWRARLVEAAAKKNRGGLFQQYDEELSVAEDWLGRSVAPLGEDLGAWLAFLRAWAMEAEPATMLERLGLTTNDVARLQRRWAARMASDDRLRKQAAEKAKGAMQELPPIRVGEAILRPSPAAKGREREPGKLLGADEMRREAAALLGRASGITASVQVPTYLLGQTADVLASDWSAPAETTDKTRELPPTAGHRSALPFGEEPVDPASLTRRGTGGAGRDTSAPTMVLPCFTAEPAPSTSPGPSEQAPGQVAIDCTLRGGLHRSAIFPANRPPARPARGPEPTAELRMDMLRPALPFVAGEAPLAPAPQPRELQGKRLARFDTQTGKPFVPARSATMRKTEVLPIFADPNDRRADTTQDGPMVPSAPALPFGGPPAPLRLLADLVREVSRKPEHFVWAAETEPPSERAPANEAVIARIPLPDLHPALPFALAPAAIPAPSPDAPRVLTLEQYASLCATLVTFPASKAATMARYGIPTDDAAAALRERWRAQFDGDPPTLARWRALFGEYCAWLSTNAGRGKLPAPRRDP